MIKYYSGLGTSIMRTRRLLYLSAEKARLHIYDNTLCVSKSLHTHEAVIHNTTANYQRSLLVSSQYSSQHAISRYGKLPSRNSFQLYSGPDTESSRDTDPEEQQRKANLGSMIETLKDLIPNILTKSLPKSIISKDIYLRVCPTHTQELNMYVPVLKGHVPYYTTCKTLQFILTSIILNPKVKLHIQSIKASTKNGDQNLEPQALFPDTTKIHVRWVTCSEGCSHLSAKDEGSGIDKGSSGSQNYLSTSDAKLGSHSWSQIDTRKLLHNPNSDTKGPNVSSSGSISSTVANLTSGLIGLTKESRKLERIISGIFIFELNPQNDSILVHTIEDVNIIEKTETQDVDGELRVC